MKWMQTAGTFGCCLGMIVLGTSLTQAQLVPGTGQKIAGDDFEKVEWKYFYNHPKSSFNIDKAHRQPFAGSNNGLFYEGAKRGTPDHVVRVKTPQGGLKGSKGSLLIQTLNSGIPGRTGGGLKEKQDDLIMRGQSMMVATSPSCVVRVYMPPFEKWNDKSDTSFGIRAACTTTIRKKSRGFLFSRNRKTTEEYWPGMFIQFNSKTDSNFKEDSAYFIIRGDMYGRDFRGPEIKKTGWWTIGMSFTPDGRVHYYAHPGIENLTQKDHIASHFPYGYKCERFSTMFFNVISKNNAKTWSTRWIIDDPTLYQNGFVRNASNNRYRR